MLFGSELRLLVRRLARAPVFMAVSVGTLSLAMGLNVAVFSLADAVLFRPLPFTAPSQIYIARLVDERSGRLSSLVPRQVLEEIDGKRGIVGVAQRGAIVNVPHDGPDGTELIGTIAVTPNFLTLLGVRPHIGRSFNTGDEEQPGRSVILTHSSWLTRFGADPFVVGREVTLGGASRQVVGVLPRQFIFPGAGLAYPYAPSGRPNYEFLTVARPQGSKGNTIDPLMFVRGSTTPETVEQEIQAIAGALGRNLKVRLVPVRAVLFPVGEIPLRSLLLAAGFVVVLGCANLAHLFFVRVRERKRELAMLAALGASRVQLLRSVFLEALCVAGLSSVIALILACISFEALQSRMPLAFSGGALIGVDWRVASYTAVVGLASALLFTALPAWEISTATPSSLTGIGRHDSPRRLISRGATILQVSLSMVLVTLAVAASRHVIRQFQEHVGFSAHGVLSVHVVRSSGGPPDTFYKELVRVAGRHPEVVSAGAAEILPLSGATSRERFLPAAGGEPIPLIRIVPGYCETAGIQLVQGRNLQDDDHAAAVVSESAARLMFPQGDVLGQQFRSANGDVRTVIGVVADTKMTAGRASDPAAYVVVEPAFSGRMELIARMRRDRSSQAAAELRQMLSRAESQMPVMVAWWADEIGAQSEYRSPRFQTLVFGLVASVAVVLAAIGVFGIVSADLRHRLHEIAIRLALGAEPRGVARRLTLEMLWPQVIGLVGGAIGAFLATRVLASRLVGFDAPISSTLAIAAVVVAMTSLASIYLPARQAASISMVRLCRPE